MAFKTAKGTSFRPEGDPVTVSMVTEEGAEIDLSAQYGLIVVDEGGEIKDHRFVVSREENILGQMVELSAGAASITAAMDKFVMQEMRADPAEYAYEGIDDEYFDKKFVKKTVDKDDVWKSEEFADKREALDTLRGDIEGILQTAQDSETGTQGDYLDLARMLTKVYDLVGRNRKALKTWALGTAETGNNMQLLTQLGKGDNSLTEAMRLAQITDAEFSVLPVSITSGKGVDRHAAQSVKAIVEQANMNKVQGVDFTADIADIEGVEMLLRHIAAQAFGVSDAVEVDDDGVFVSDLTAAVLAVDAAAGEFVAEYNDKFGKHINPYNSNEYDTAKRAFGAVRVSSAGAGLMRSAVEAVEKYHASDDDDAEGRKKLLSGLFVARGGNALVKEAYKAAKDHATKVATEATNRAAVKAATSDDKAVFSKTARAQFSSLPPLAAAATLYSLMAEHEMPEKVEAALKGLMSQGIPITKPTAKDDAADE